MVFNATFNNISVMSWWSVLLVEETGVSREAEPGSALAEYVNTINNCYPEEIVK
jgi:hypothetical protein